MLVCGRSIRGLDVYSILKNVFLKEKLIWFSDFTPNPGYEEVVNGVALFRKEQCNAILAIGGGSAIDVAKCIKLFSGQNTDGKNGEFLQGIQDKPLNIEPVPLLAMPTTAGTGSETTRYAVIYYKGEKQSITSLKIIPDAVLLDPEVLKTLPLYQKKATMLDALCHAIESYWSINSTEESQGYSKEALCSIVENITSYLRNEDEGNKAMMHASYLAGKAINISQTTAGHAMCYKITGIFGVAHGHAAALCDRVLYKWMVDNIDNDNCKERDSRGKNYLRQIFLDIAVCFGGSTMEEGAERFETLFDELKLEIPTANEFQYNQLVSAVNPERLRNHPIELDDEAIAYLYKKILR